MLIYSLSIAVGILLLIWSSDRFVRAAARLAFALSVSPVVVGAIVIGFGTSSPELLVSTIAALQGKLDIAIGSVIGSNISNLTLICGAAACVAPLAVTSATLRREAPLATLGVIALAIALQDELTRFTGVLLIGGLCAALMLMLRSGSAPEPDDADLTQEAREFADEAPCMPASTSMRANITWIIVGLVGTVAGAQALVWGASNMAMDLGMSAAMVGLTIVAVGTSLPELATAIQGARKGEDELVMGNLLGSNLFNSLGIVGVAAIVGPGRISTELAGLPVMLMVAVASFVALVAFARKQIGRTTGIALVASYPVILLLLTR